MGSNDSKPKVFQLTDELSITRREIKVIRHGWNKIRSVPVDSGVAIIATLLWKHPSMKSLLFPTYDNVPLKHLRDDKRFQAHCSMFIHTCDNIIAHIEDKELMEHILKSIMQRHSHVPLRRDHVRAMEQVTVRFLRSELDLKYDPEASRAWAPFLIYVFRTLRNELEV